MRKIGYKVLLLLVISFSIMANSLMPSMAATGYQGYGVYRNGVKIAYGMWYSWHAALMDDPSYSYYRPVTHHPGYGFVAKYGTWAEFLDGDNQYQGTYRPIQAPTNATRDLFVSMGRRLVNENIPYTVFSPVHYNPYTTGGYVLPQNISHLRCDGVIEYIYEYYSHRVWGSDAYWDVSWNDRDVRSMHEMLTPRIQAQQCLVQLLPSEILP